MSHKKILLVTFPVDLGNRTIESNLQRIFKDDMDFFRFAPQHASVIDKGKINPWKSTWFKLKSIIALRKAVRAAVKKDQFILFANVSPALFSYGIWKPNKTTITLDWTKTLFYYVYDKKIKKGSTFYLHKKILNTCSKIICSTDAVTENLRNTYGVENKRIFKAPVPFLAEDMDIPPRKTSDTPKVLFVAGDLKRKGGNVLLKNWKDKLEGKCTLSMVTNVPPVHLNGVQFLPGIKHGTPSHKEVFKTHDILVLPTYFDPGPQVICEAAAAGQAVITTKNALLSSEVIEDNTSGYICNTSRECIDRLSELLSNPTLIDAFKYKGYEYIHHKFSRKNIHDRYLEIINNEYHE